MLVVPSSYMTSPSCMLSILCIDSPSVTSAGSSLAASPLEPKTKVPPYLEVASVVLGGVVVPWSAQPPKIDDSIITAIMSPSILLSLFIDFTLETHHN
ncbi:MAG TPA: hypothetical protein PKO31_03230 [Methanofastidiosum sp.]|nr:hypothetical protein [Methanofastidiosum sp.]